MFLEKREKNRIAKMNREGLEGVHISGLQICLLNISKCFGTVCFTYISDVKLDLSRWKGRFMFQLGWLGKCNSTFYPQSVN